MNIAVDGEACLYARAGISRYIMMLLEQLVGCSADHYTLFLPGLYFRRRAVRELLCRELRSRYRPQDLEIRSAAQIPRNILQYIWTRTRRPRVDLWLKNIDVYHGTNLFVPPLKKPRGVLTIHDLFPLTHPQFFVPGTRRWCRESLTSSIRYCQRVIADSQYAKEEFLRIFKYPEDHIHVVPLAANPLFRRIEKSEKLEKLRSKLGLPAHFVLSVGTLEPRKNLAGLIRAFAYAKDRLPRDCELVITGSHGWLYDSVFSAVEKTELHGRVRFTGFLEDEDLVGVYNLASCIAYPSFGEGFGLPILEGMACGTPVITGNNTSLKEVAGDAACLVDVADQASLADSLVRFIVDSDQRKRYSALGLERSKLFSWERTARETHKIYELAMG